MRPDFSLRIDAATRPPPRDMLKHPWIQESMARKLDMAKWIREVWGWEKPIRPKRSSQTSQLVRCVRFELLYFASFSNEATQGWLDWARIDAKVAVDLYWEAWVRVYEHYVDTVACFFLRESCCSIDFAINRIGCWLMKDVMCVWQTEYHCE
jgi:hypothetical protein